MGSSWDKIKLILPVFTESLSDVITSGNKRRFRAKLCFIVKTWKGFEPRKVRMRPIKTVVLKLCLHWIRYATLKSARNYNLIEKCKSDAIRTSRAKFSIPEHSSSALRGVHQLNASLDRKRTLLRKLQSRGNAEKLSQELFVSTFNRFIGVSLDYKYKNRPFMVSF